MAKFAPNVGLDQSSITAWSDGMMLKTAVEKLGAEARIGPITTEMVLKAMRAIKGEKLQGLVAPQTYSSAPDQPHPQGQCYFPATFGNDGQWHPLPPACLPGKPAGG